MFPNAKGSELFSVLATHRSRQPGCWALSPPAGSRRATTTALLALVQTGVLGTGATLDAKLQQATGRFGHGCQGCDGQSHHPDRQGHR